MRFSYVALNQEHKKLTGILSAESEGEAREKLHSMQLSVITLEKKEGNAESEEETEGITTFSFHVVDSRGVHTNGTIDAKDRGNAFYRLISEYGFQVISLCSTDISAESREKRGAEGLEELAEEVEEEYGVVQKSPVHAMQGDFITQQSEDFLDAKHELVESVEEIVERAEQVLEKFERQLTTDEFQAIKHRIDSLMRLRLSNNLKYIQDLTDELLVLVDTTLQQHAEISEEDRDAHSFGVLGNEVEDDNSTEYGALSHFKKISLKMRGLLGGYSGKKANLRKKKKKDGGQEHSTFIRTHLIIRSIKRAFSSLKRALFAHNSVVRKQHIKNMVTQVKNIQQIIKTPKKKLIAVAENMNLQDQEEEKQKIEEREVSRIYQKTSIFHFFQELHLFFGWLLAFYAAYFYFSAFVLVKWGSASPLFSFLRQSLESSFPFLAIGCFFILFSGLTFSVRFSYGRVILPSFYCLITFFLIALFLINF